MIHCGSVSDSGNLQVHHPPYGYCSQASFLLQSETKKTNIHIYIYINQHQLNRLQAPTDNYRTTLKTAGSFISFHIPSTPLQMKSLTKSAHHERTFACVKSGKTQGPGHTSPVNGNVIITP